MEPLQLLRGPMWTKRPLLAASSTALAAESPTACFLKVLLCQACICALPLQRWVRAEPRGGAVSQEPGLGQVPRCGPPAQLPRRSPSLC